MLVKKQSKTELFEDFSGFIVRKREFRVFDPRKIEEMMSYFENQILSLGIVALCPSSPKTPEGGRRASAPLTFS